MAIEHHIYVGIESSCLQRVPNGAGWLRCGFSLTHPVHTGVCIHCAYKLEMHKGDGVEVCRHCHKHYLSCTHCRDGTWHAS